MAAATQTRHLIPFMEKYTRRCVARKLCSTPSSPYKRQKETSSTFNYPGLFSLESTCAKRYEHGCSRFLTPLARNSPSRLSLCLSVDELRTEILVRRFRDAPLNNVVDLPLSLSLFLSPPPHALREIPPCRVASMTEKLVGRIDVVAAKP